MSHCRGSENLLGCGDCRYYFLQDLPQHLTPGVIHALLSLYLKVLSKEEICPPCVTDTYITCDGRLAPRMYEKPLGLIGGLECGVHTGFSVSTLMSSVGRWLELGSGPDNLNDVPRNRLKYRNEFEKYVVMSAATKHSAVQNFMDLDAMKRTTRYAATQAGLPIIHHLMVVEHEGGLKRRESSIYL